MRVSEYKYGKLASVTNNDKRENNHVNSPIQHHEMTISFELLPSRKQHEVHPELKETTTQRSVNPQTITGHVSILCSQANKPKPQLP